MSVNIRIVPAILTDDSDMLKKLVHQTETFTDYAQFDIMDGQFVPSRSVSCSDIASLKMNLTWEAHLMVMNPETCLQDFHKAGAKKIVFHYQATSSPEKVIELIKNTGIEAGLAINPEVPISRITSLIDRLDSVLFLSVNPGFYGAKFIPEVMEKIKSFHRAYPDIEIGIDGGIKESNIAEIARTGVNVIYVGSAIFLQPDPAGSYHRLTELAISNAA